MHLRPLPQRFSFSLVVGAAFLLLCIGSSNHATAVHAGVESPTTHLLLRHEEETQEQTKPQQEKNDPVKSTTTATSSSWSSYGVDVSFPIFHGVSTNYPWLPHNQLNHSTTTTTTTIPSQYKHMPLQPLGDRQRMYREHLQACRDAYPHDAESCDQHEYSRMMMNLRQPASMVNFTKQGFQKIKAPAKVVQLIDKFWSQNHYKGQEEIWPEGNTYVNHWESPTYLISVDDQGLRGSGPELKRQIWAAAAATLEEWTEQELQPCSLYGIRVYGEGSIMLPHVDRLPLVVSAMIPVAQQVDEPWPLEVYDHDGKAHNITMEPGEMLLFESHSVIHGHPFPLKGEFVALIFIHFEPTGTALHQDNSGIYHRNGASIDEHYRTNIAKGVGGPSAMDDGINLPPYIKRESPEEQFWKETNPEGWTPPEKVLPSTAHLAAKTGNFEQLAKELEQSLSEQHQDSDSADDNGDENTKNEEQKQQPQSVESLLTQRDENGWQVLHQGVVSGKKEIVELLVQRGASINSRTHGGYGETPLRIAEKRHGNNHPIVQYLRSLGALSLGPEL
ncbi:hypothetical protein ACA910_001229 [Epithemia clementina (nom. ined.)]